MARIRTIKPEFFRHEELQDLELSHPEKRPMLTFAALWGHCDKHGVFEFRPRHLALDILPFIWGSTGEAPEKHLGSTLDLLVKHRFIVRYEYKGKQYGFIPTFSDHQRINGKEKLAPSHFPKIEEMTEVCFDETTGEAPGKHPRSTGEAPGTAGREGKGREEEGKNIKAQGQKLEKSPPPSSASIELPSFISPEAWFGFLEMRKKIKKPATERACLMLIKKLIMFNNAGHDVNAILDQSTISGWQDLYELKDDYRAKRQGPKTYEQQKMDNIKRAMVDFVGGDHDGPGQEAVRVTHG